MFTRCPNCLAEQTLTVEQLRITRAITYCPHCASHFDALEQLSARAMAAPETEPAPPQEPTSATDTPSVLPWEKPTAIASPHWRSGVYGGVLLLIGQLGYFHSHAISNNATVRRLCQPLRCPLPPYRNAAELAVIHNVLEPLASHGYLFKALVNNQAAFSQAYPTIVLTLQDYGGNTVAQRRFKPEDYLLNPQNALIRPDATVELSLHIAPTTETVGGYTFDLTY